MPMEAKKNDTGMTLRMIYEKVYFSIKQHEVELLAVEELDKEFNLYEKILFMGQVDFSVKDLENMIGEHKKILISQTVLLMREELTAIFYESGYRFNIYSNEESIENLLNRFDEQSITSQEILVLMFQMIQVEDLYLIQYLLNGFFLRIIELLKKILNDSVTKYNHTLMSIYQRSLNQMFNLCNDKEEAILKYKILNRLIEKERPLKPTIKVDNSHSEYLCPRCKKGLIIKKQNYCTNCGQKISHNS